MYNAAYNKINAEKVKWSSSNKEILTVNSKGVITGLSTGTATVYGTYLNHKYSREVSVEWCELDNISITVPYPQDKGLINFNYTTNYPNGIKVELGAGSELVKVFHQNLGNGDNRHASVYCYPNATGQVELKVRTLSEPDAYFSYKLNFRKGKFIGIGDMKSEEAQNSSSKSTLPPPTYSEAGIMNLGYMTDNLQIAIEDSIADNTMSYLYKFYGTDIEAMAIIATYRDYLLDNGWRFHKSESNDAGGVTHALYNSNYLVGLSCDPIYENDGSVAYYAISVTILRRS